MSLVALWDLGNVVVQWDPVLIREMTGLPDEKLDLLKTPSFEQLWLDLDQGLTDEAQVTKQLINETDLSPADVQLYFATVRESLVDLTESVALIRQMKASGIKMYVLSNMSLVNADYLRQRDYFALFDGIVISAEEKLIKPDTDLFHVVVDRYELEPAMTVFVDDSLANIEAAESLGMQGVHFKRSAACYSRIRKHFNL